MKVAKKACARCGSRSLREDGGQYRCAQCGRTSDGGSAPMLESPVKGRRDTRWEVWRR